MAGGHPAAGCCCFLHNTRFLVLLLTTFAISVLYANLVLFNLTAIHHTELNDERPVNGLDSLHEFTGWQRIKRDASDNTPRVKYVNNDEDDDDDGHPILPNTPSPKTTTTTPIPTTKKKTEKPKPIFFTNSPVIETTTMLTSTIRSEREVNKEPDDVVAREVERSLKKLKEAEENEEKSAKENVVEKVKDDPFKKPEVPTLIRVTRTLLYVAPGIGIVIGTLLLIFLGKKVSIHTLFAVFLVLSAMMTISLSFAVNAGYPLLLSIRFLQGLLFSIVFPVMGNVLINWGPLKSQLVFLSIMFLFFAFGHMYSWPLTATLLSNDVDLQYIYYGHASVLVVTALAWLIFHRDSPRMHPWVSGVELNIIVAGKVQFQELHNNRAQSDSFTSLLRSLSAWSIWISSFGLFSAVAFFSTYLPSFLSCHEIFYVSWLGGSATAPFFLLPIICISFAIINKLLAPSTKAVRIMNTVGFILGSIIFLCIPFISFLQNEAVLMTVLFIVLLPFGLAIVNGFGRSLTIVGRVFAQQIVTICGLSFGFAFIVIPIVVNVLVKENKLGEWTTVIMVLGFIFLASAVEFAMFGRGRSASWAESSWDPLVASTKMQSLALIDFNQDECGLYELRRVEPTK